MRLLNSPLKVTFYGGAGGYGECGTRVTLGGDGGYVASVEVGAGVGSGAGVGPCTLVGAILFLRIVPLGAAWEVVTDGLVSGVGAMEGVAR